MSQDQKGKLASKVDEMNFEVTHILARPYHWVIVPEGAAFSAFIAEFQGCYAMGDTPGEALENLGSAAQGWLQAVIEMKQPVPEPFEWGWAHKLRDSLAGSKGA